ncbi:hypothetical protein [Deinococcus aquatilis]|uniref:hypothetical protein n=1 Tax=Deinococcus aquatilis TaxID=519440 RepID=UPI0003682F89|nr:hypothetical protein [Deinococcus aquatilis]
MAISQEQVQRIQEAHQLGHLDPGIAQHAGVSLATVKRYRTQFGLKTNCVTALRGELGEQLMADHAAARGLPVAWRAGHNDKHDLVIAGQRVDAKATMRLADGSWRFRLPSKRKSFYKQYSYPKDYAADCDVIALVALHPGTQSPDFYFLPSAGLLSDIRIRAGGSCDSIKNDWSLLEGSGPALQA